MKNDKTKETEKQAKEEIAVNLEELNEIEKERVKGFIFGIQASRKQEEQPAAM